MHAEVTFSLLLDGTAVLDDLPGRGGARSTARGWCRSARSATSAPRAMTELPPGLRMSLGPDDALLTGKVAVVTGAGQGIGAACATTLARFGCDVAIVDRVPDGLPGVRGRDRGGRSAAATRSQLDVRDAAATAAWIDRVAERFGPIDVLVNNAGGTFRAPYESISPNAEAALLSENFGQVSSTTRAVLPHMPEPAARSSTSPRSRPTGPRPASPSTRRPRRRSPTSRSRWRSSSRPATSG